MGGSGWLGSIAMAITITSTPMKATPAPTPRVPKRAGSVTSGTSSQLAV